MFALLCGLAQANFILRQSQASQAMGFTIPHLALGKCIIGGMSYPAEEQRSALATTSRALYTVWMVNIPVCHIQAKQKLCKTAQKFQLQQKLAAMLMLDACSILSLRMQRAFFPGDSELQQLLYIFKILGTPTEDTWPGVTELKDWHEFPNWHAQDLQKVFPTLHPDGVDLMRRMFIYDPAKRISVRSHLAEGMQPMLLLLSCLLTVARSHSKILLQCWSMPSMWTVPSCV